jgi:hypothetical protein
VTAPRGSGDRPFGGLAERLSHAPAWVRLLVAAGWTAALAGIAWLVTGTGFVNYDSEYELVWGAQLADGIAPDTTVPLAPTPHPLATLAGFVLSPMGDEAETALVVIGFLALGAVGWLIYRVGAVTAWWPVGVLAAVLVLTREPVLSFGARAYIDLPYLALVLGAVLVEARRPRAGAPVLVLLAVAGLIRPEAWVLGAAYVVWLAAGPPVHARGQVSSRASAAPPDSQRAMRLAPIVLAAPVIWALGDLLVFGDLMHSASGPSENADLLNRPGIGDVPTALPRRLGEVLREPVLLGAAGGAVAGLVWLRRAVALPLSVAAVAIAALVALVAAGLPLTTRYLLLPAALLCLVCAVGILGWPLLKRGHPARRWWAGLGALIVLLLAVFAPAQAGRIDRLGDALAAQERIRSDLHELVSEGAFAPERCGRISVPNSRSIPELALWLDRTPSAITTRLIASGTWVAPMSETITERYQLDPNDLAREIDRPPPGFRLSGANRSWLVYTRC